MYSGRGGALGVEKKPRKHARSNELDKLVQWLVDRGVDRKQARKFIIKCASQFLSERSVCRVLLVTTLSYSTSIRLFNCHVFSWNKRCLDI